MESQTKQTTPAASPPTRIAWINGEPFQLGSVATPAARSLSKHASTNLRIQNPQADDYTPATRARKAKRRLRRLFEHARRNAKGRARLCRSHEYEILRVAYRSVRAWRREGVDEEIERELRAGAEVAVSRRSSLFLLLIRCALPRLEIRRASKWAAAMETADRQEIRSKRLCTFLHNNGGIEGAARVRGKLEKEVSVRDVCDARSPNAG
jgi:hypothetical protein